MNLFANIKDGTGRRKIYVFVFALAASACAALGAKPSAAVSESAAGGVQLLSFARVIDGTGDVLPGREIAVADGRILAVGNGLDEKYPGARHVALDHLTALPGLIDAHVHITYGLGGPSRGDAWTQLLQETPPGIRLQAAREKATATLHLGVTTVRDMFALDGVDFELREQVERGEVQAPRLFLSGTGIHPLVMPKSDDSVSRIESMRQRASQVADHGADWLKIFATTGTASDLTGEQIYSEAEICAATEVAHACGMKVAVHAYGPSAVPAAIRCGVDSIEHAVDVDDATLRAWAAAGIAYIPTIDHNRYYADHRDEYGFDEGVAEALRAFTARNVSMLRRAHEAGVPIVFGSDAVMTMFGENTLELEWFVKAGLTPSETIRSATVNPAKLLGQEDRLGRISPGFAADLIAVEGNPLDDIGMLVHHVVWVMLAGKIVAGHLGSE